MSLMESLKFWGKEEEESSDEIGENFATELDEGFEEGGWGEEEEDDWEEEEEEVVEEWDTAYRFAEDMLEPDGHANMTDFANSFMFYKVRRSPLFRDRIAEGTKTIDQVSTAKKRMDEMRGGKKETDFESMAERMEAANRAINAADKLGGREEAMMQDAMALGTELVQAATSAMTERGGPVNSRVTETEERI